MRSLSLRALAALGLISIACQRGAQKHEQEGAEAGGGEQAAPRVTCGSVLCEAGQVCCNPSCNICAAPDGMCTQQFCDQSVPEARAGKPSTEPPPAGSTPTCDQHRCGPGHHCELIAVQCVRAPCEPVPQCVPDKPSP